MRKIYFTTDGVLQEVDTICDGCYINLSNPTEAEIMAFATALRIDADDLRAPLDLEERSRVSVEDGYVLIVVDIPIGEDNVAEKGYTTIPLGIIVTKEAIVTTCLRDVTQLLDLVNGPLRNFNTFMKTRIIFQILYTIANLYLYYLKQIDVRSANIERQLHVSMRNTELIAMLNLEKSLVYFSTSLRSNQRVLEKLLRTESIKKYPDDEDLLEDAIEENRQAIEMADIYSNILSGTMDAYASVISNNQNTVMKILALITIIMSIPTMIFSAYGMNLNTGGMPFTEPVWGFGLIVVGSFFVSLIVTVVFFFKKWF